MKIPLPRPRRSTTRSCWRPAGRKATGFNIVNQISFRCGALAELKAVTQAIAGEAVSEVRPISHANAWSLYFRDPEGNRIEIFVDSPWYVAQPMREPLDLDRSDAEIVAATEVFCRDRPGFKPRPTMPIFAPVVRKTPACPG